MDHKASHSRRQQSLYSLLWTSHHKAKSFTKSWETLSLSRNFWPCVKAEGILCSQEPTNLIYDRLSCTDKSTWKWQNCPHCNL